ncbi:exodeoxyribonuclease VII small subunit [Salinarchaeum laminariae]|uniref:exodeoxyribonuclease VII small subunit n=1 Tax=Salinarchaeum laminariae TaxID=869888 RepID=UPI0020BF326D|nr:exodeoxyribonuclease VII small subunit [Salinarchaeum laminariae]
MTDTADPTTAAQPETIAEKRDRIETITEQLEDGEVSLERAKQLHEQGQTLIEDLRGDLDLGDGSVTVRE